MSRTLKQTEWRKQNIDIISIETRKDDAIKMRVEKLIDAGKAKSKQAFYVSAILSALEKAESELPNN